MSELNLFTKNKNSPKLNPEHHYPVVVVVLDERNSNTSVHHSDAFIYSLRTLRFLGRHVKPLFPTSSGCEDFTALPAEPLFTFTLRIVLRFYVLSELR